MKSDRLQDAIGEIKDSYILEANTAGRKRIAPVITKWVAAAACLVIVVGGVYVVLNSKKGTLEVADDLPQIEIGEYITAGMGYEAYLEYSPEELENGNPWDEDAALDTLPVYINGNYDPTGVGIPLGFNEEEMKDRLYDMADKLGISISDTDIEYIGDPVYNEMIGGDPEKPFVYAASYSDDSTKITANADGMIQIEYLNETAIPSDYASLLYYSDPKTYTCGSYYFSGEYSYKYYVFDESNDTVENLLNYNFRYAELIPDSDGNLWMIKINDNLSKAEKLGDYPLISSKEAKKKLLKGEYQSSIYDFEPTSKGIVKVELVYRTGPFEKNLLPYYKFYVEMPSENEEAESLGLKNYGVFYVPAIKDEYLSGLETYDGRIN